MNAVRCIWNARATLGEGPVYDPRDDSLLFVDIDGKWLHRLDLATGAQRTWSTPDKICWVVPRAHRAGYIAGMRTSIGELDLDPFAYRPFTGNDLLPPGTRLNDAEVDAVGRIWAGSLDEAESEPHGALFRVDGDRSLHAMDAGYIVANGPTFCPRGEFLYHTDSARRTVWRFALSASGELSERRVFVQFEDNWGYPDGMTTDAEGSVWIAHWDGGRLSRFSSTGDLQRSIALPVSRVTSCTFAGPKRDRLFVTSAARGREHETLAGALFEVESDVAGLPPRSYAG